MDDLERQVYVRFSYCKWELFRLSSQPHTCYIVACERACMCTFGKWTEATDRFDARMRYLFTLSTKQRLKYHRKIDLFTAETELPLQFIAGQTHAVVLHPLRHAGH